MTDPRQLLIGEIFRRNAEQVPEQTAASLGSADWTHRDLNAAGNRMAHTLAERGVGAGDRVVSWAETDRFCATVTHVVASATATTSP